MRTYLRTLPLALLLVLFAISSETHRAQAPEADQDYQTGAVLWQQCSAEARALQYQAFTLARLMLDRDLAVNRRLRKKRAVVVDIDETVLDNTRFQAQLIKERRPYNQQEWLEWCNLSGASAIPGAVGFLQYAVRHRVSVFYVTNRRLPEKPGTIMNLKKLGFPNVNDDTVIVRSDASSKEARRQKIREHYRIVLLCGDNLADFSDLFSGKGIKERAAVADSEQARFGREFIVLPNPMYGDWEGAMYGPAQLNEEEKAAKRMATLEGFR
jgi:5'-nucleotidase (lipoprotein e(P4) family)